MPFKKLVDAHNEILRLSLRKQKKGSITAPRMERALEEALEGFEEALSELGDRHFDHGSHRGTYEHGEFERTFISQERMILNDSSLSKESVKVLITRVRQVHRENVGNLTQADLGQIEEALKEVKAALEELQSSGANPLETKRKVQKKWGRITKLVGGTVLIGLDGFAALANPALAPISAMSAAVGGTIIAERRSRD